MTPLPPPRPIDLVDGQEQRVAEQALAVYLHAHHEARRLAEPWEAVKEQAREALEWALDRLAIDRIKTEFGTATRTPACVRVMYDAAGLDELMEGRPDLRPLLLTLREEREYKGRLTVRVAGGTDNGGDAS